jgi:hypothetical protein
VDEDSIQQYQSLIGSMQWAISIGCFDIVVHMSCQCLVSGPGLVMDTLTEPNAWLAISPSLNCQDTSTYQWAWLFRCWEDWIWLDKSVYGDVSEIIPNDTPPPLGGFITLTHYQDANLYHNITTGCSITVVSCTSWTRCLSTGTLRNKLLSKRQHTGVNSFLLEPESTRLLIYASP